MRLLISSALFLCIFSFVNQSALAAENQVTPKISARGDYNDNIFFEKENEKNDYVLTITPELLFARRTEQLNTQLRLDFPIFRYADFDELDAIDQNYTGNIRYQWTPRLATSLNARYTIDSQPGRDIYDTGLATGDDTRRSLNTGLSGEYALSEVTYAGLSYTYGEDKYDDPDSIDTESHNVSLTLNRNLEKYLANTYGRITLSGIRYDSTGSAVESYSAMVGAVKKLTEVYSISADIGLRYTQSELDVLQAQFEPPDTFRIVTATQKDDNLGTVGRVAVSYQGEATRLSLSFYQDISTSSGQSGAVERTSFTFDLGRRFTYKMWGHFAAGYYINESKGQEFSIEDIDEHTIRFDPYIRYEYSKNLSFRTTYSYTKINDRIDDSDSERNLIFFQLAYLHPLLQ